MDNLTHAPVVPQKISPFIGIVELTRIIMHQIVNYVKEHEEDFIEDDDGLKYMIVSGNMVRKIYFDSGAYCARIVSPIRVLQFLFYFSGEKHIPYVFSRTKKTRTDWSIKATCK